MVPKEALEEKTCRHGETWWVDLLSVGARVGGRWKDLFLLLKKENWSLGLNIHETVVA